jgi:hypothetical protein
MAKAAHVMSKTWHRNHIPLMSKPRDLDRMLRLKAQFTSYLKQLQHMDSSKQADCRRSETHDSDAEFLKPS